MPKTGLLSENRESGMELKKAWVYAGKRDGAKKSLGLRQKALCCVMLTPMAMQSLSQWRRLKTWASSFPTMPFA